MVADGLEYSVLAFSGTAKSGGLTLLTIHLCGTKVAVLGVDIESDLPLFPDVEPRRAASTRKLPRQVRCGADARHSGYQHDQHPSQFFAPKIKFATETVDMPPVADQPSAQSVTMQSRSRRSRSVHRGVFAIVAAWSAANRSSNAPEYSSLQCKPARVGDCSYSPMVGTGVMDQSIKSTAR